MAFASVSGAMAQTAESETPPPAQASEENREVLRTQLSGFAIELPAPPWIVDDGTSLSEQAEISMRRTRGGPMGLVVNKPGENAVSWTELLGVVAIDDPGITAGMQFQTTARAFGASCSRTRFNFFWIPPLPDGDREVLVGMCGRFSLQSNDPQRCDGGIIAVVAVEKEPGLVSAWSRWCTPSFDIDDEASWPVSRATIESRARRLQEHTDFVPAETPESAD